MPYLNKFLGRILWFLSVASMCGWHPLQEKSCCPQSDYTKCKEIAPQSQPAFSPARRGLEMGLQLRAKLPAFRMKM